MGEVKPYYEEKGIVIYHADCRKVLPSLSVDITVTSPPYNQIDPSKMKPSGMTKDRGAGLGWIEKFKQDGYTDNLPESEYQSFVRGVVGDCLQISMGLVWVNHKTRYRDKAAIHPLSFLPFPLYSEIVWDRGGSLTLNARKFAPSHEYFFGFGQPHYWDNRFNTEMSVWRISKTGIDGHVCSYPPSLIRPLIAASCPTGGIVLDPFMGSGTTLRAAKDLGLKAIGIEIEERYCEIAANRLRQEVFDFEQASSL